MNFSQQQQIQIQEDQRNISLKKEETTEYQDIQEVIEEYKGVKWDNNFYRLVKTNFQIKYTLNQEITYIADGQILRIDHIKDSTQKPEIIKNLEQVKYLKWIGNYGEQNQKVGLWSAQWKEQILKDVGGQYTEQGQKQGFWKDLTKSYWDESQAYEIGEYQQGQRRGKWTYLFQDKEIGGGQYNDFGRKIGKWVELSDTFWNENQVLYIGEYNNGIKVGAWSITSDGQQIGGGLYEDLENGEKKIGRWIELSEFFDYESVITYIGDYKNGLKVGNWEIFWKFQGINKKIGGGDYEEQQGVGQKVGKWIEDSDVFFCWRQITFAGEYKQGKKVGKWEIYYHQAGKNQLVGCGSYDQEGNQIKIGSWIEISDYFYVKCQVTFKGDYKNGKKVGSWQTYFQKNYGDYQNELIGGGLYDDQSGAKSGKWIELMDTFDFSNQVIQSGEYNNGKKCGVWEEMQRHWRDKEFKKNGEKIYDN